MDLKSLLLHSISSGHALCYHKLLSFNNNCFAVAFEVKGKILTIKRIKQVNRKMTLKARLARRRRFLHRMLKVPELKIFVEVGTETDAVIDRQLELESILEVDPEREPEVELEPELYLEPEPELMFEVDSEPQIELRDMQTQTTSVKRRHRGTAMELNSFKVDRDQQTLHKSFRKIGLQTDWNTSALGIQTESLSMTRDCQTEWVYYQTMALQTDAILSNHVQMQTEAQQENIERLSAEKEAVVYLLNEIGEMIINQNHLLHNNATLLGQISEMTMLGKMMSRQNAALKMSKKVEKRSNTRRYTRRYGRFRCIHIYKKRPKAETRNMSAQTVFQLEIAHKSTQTVFNTRIRKPSRFFFCF